MIRAYKNLALHICLQAVKDYRMARKKLKKRPENKDAQLMIEDCEAFFRSAWFQFLTDVDGENILRRLQEEKYG